MGIKIALLIETMKSCVQKGRIPRDGRVPQKNCSFIRGALSIPLIAPEFGKSRWHSLPKPPITPTGDDVMLKQLPKSKQHLFFGYILMHATTSRVGCVP